jgi:hypothetical protein
MANRTRSKKRSKNKKSKKMYIQRGGVFTDDETNILFNQGGFNQQEIDFLNQNNVSFQNIQTANNYALNNNHHTIALFIASCLQNNPNQNEMPQDEMPQDEDEEEGNPDLNQAFIQGNNNDDLNDSGATDPEQDSSILNDIDDDDVEENIEDMDLGLNDEDENPQQGGKRRKTIKGRKGKNGKKTRKQRGGTEFSEEQLTELGRLGFNDNQKKFLAQEFGITPPDVAMNAIRQAVQRNHPTGRPDTVEGGKRRRKTRKMRGGMRYGTGVGSNCFDPNFSIYNTPTLSLFPYKPN